MPKSSARRTWLLTLAVIISSGSALRAQARPAATTPCAYTLSQYSISVPSPGAQGSIMVNTGNTCGWSASSDVPWITILLGSNGTGPGTIGYSLAANPNTTSRTGHLTVQGQTVAITEVALLGPGAQVQSVWTARAQILDQTNTTACTTAPGVVTTFLPTDAAAYVFVSVTQVNAGDVISTQYIAPNGTLYANSGGSYTVPMDVQSVCVEDQGMRIVGAPPAGMPGVWTANVKVNGVLVITASFTILGSSSCAYSLSPASLSVPPLAASGFQIQVTTSGGCAWTATSNMPWLIVTAGFSGTGSGMVVFSVEANPGGSRTGNLSIGGQVAAITQVALLGPQDQVTQVWTTHTPFPNSNAPCSDASAASTTYAPSDAAAYLFLTIAGAKAGDRISDQYFAPDGTLYANAGSSVTVPPLVQFSCWEDTGLMIRGTNAANLTGAWTVEVQINGVVVITTSFTMLGGSNCTYAINSTSATIAAAGGSGTVTVNTGPGCSWAASSSTSWIHITAGTAGSGGAPVTYSVDVNSGASRTGTLTIAGQVFTLTQASALPPLPTITPGGVADPWTSTVGVSPGAWVVIYGSNLASGTQTWSPSPGQALPTTLGGVDVTVDGNAAVLSYVSPTQVNVLVPAAVRLGPVQIVVTSQGQTSDPYMAQSTQVLPAIYSNAFPGTSPARYSVTAVDPLTNNLLGNLSADPRVVGAAHAGQTIDLYAAGLGPSTPQFPTDTYFTGVAYGLTSGFHIVMNGMPVPPMFAELVAPGLYQMRFTIPASMPAGDQPILLDFGGGVESAANVFLSIQR